MQQSGSELVVLVNSIVDQRYHMIICPTTDLGYEVHLMPALRWPLRAVVQVRPLNGVVFDRSSVCAFYAKSTAHDGMSLLG